MLAPWVIAGALFFPYLAYQAFLAKETTGAVIAVVLSLCCIFFLLMALSPGRFGWLSIFISGSITAAYIWYFCDVYFAHHQPIKLSLNFAKPSPFNAILGFLVWGLPAAIFTVRGIKKLIAQKTNGDFR